MNENTWQFNAETDYNTDFNKSEKTVSPIQNQNSIQNQINSHIKDNKYITPNKIYLKISDPVLGLGVFASDDIKKGDLIERCPLIQLGWRQRYINDPILQRYVFSQKCKCESCQEHGSIVYLLLGYGSFYNHKNKPNTDLKFKFKNLLLDIIASEDIQKDDEIYISYGPSYFGGQIKYYEKDKK